MNYFSHEFQTNIYMTPAHSQGFTPHYDTHDVFVLQISGEKHWQIFEVDTGLPLKNNPFVKEGFEPGKVIDEFVLKEGDFLYIPRGRVHDAHTKDQYSMHITVGLLAHTWTDFLAETIAHLSGNNIEFRNNLPVGYTQNGDGQKHEGKIHELLQIISQELLSNQGFLRFRDRLFENNVRYVPNQLNQILHLDEINQNTILHKRHDTSAWMEHEDGQLILNVYNSQIEFPAEVEPVLRFVLDRDRPFQPKDLPEIIDEDSKVFAVKKLVEEGLIYAEH
jgi:ribosomal protein L16 Arg81 hydroxylase